MDRGNGSYVQYGAGLSAPKGWRNFDSSPTLRLQRAPAPLGALARRTMKPHFPSGVECGDIVLGLPLEVGECNGIYASHVLEHLSLTDLRTALLNTRSYLAEGGIFRLVVPDLRRLAGDYLSSEDPMAANQFMKDSGLGTERRRRGVGGLLRAWLGNSAHLWMWDFPSLAAELGQAGFRGTRRAAIGDSRDPRFGAVEDPDRWQDCLGIECHA